MTDFDKMKVLVLFIGGIVIFGVIFFSSFNRDYSKWENWCYAHDGVPLIHSEYHGKSNTYHKVCIRRVIYGEHVLIGE